MILEALSEIPSFSKFFLTIDMQLDLTDCEEGNATIIRFMKGVYNLRPTEVRYCKTWDVSKVLVFLRKLTPVRFLS
jgi:hypothetical protein